MSEVSKCCTCGNEWVTGQDGRHSCIAELLDKLELRRWHSVLDKVSPPAYLGLLEWHCYIPPNASYIGSKSSRWNMVQNALNVPPTWATHWRYTEFPGIEE